MIMRKKYYALLIVLAFIAVGTKSCTAPDDRAGEIISPAVVETEIPEAMVSEAPPEEISPEEDIPEEPLPEITYVLNTNSHKFHKPFCRSVEQIKPTNYQETSATRQEVLDQGYTPCGNCKP